MPSPEAAMDCFLVQAWEEEKRENIMDSMGQALLGVASHCSQKERESWPSHLSLHLGLAKSPAADSSREESSSSFSHIENDLDW